MTLFLRKKTISAMRLKTLFPLFSFPMKRLAAALAAVAFAASATAQKLPTKEDEAFYRTEEARRIGEQVLLFQRVTGGRPENIDMARPLTADAQTQVKSSVC